MLFLGTVIFTATHFLIYEFQILPETHLWFYVFLYLGLISICCALFFPFAIHLRSIKPFDKLFYFLSTRSYAIYLVNYSILLLNLQRSFNIGSMQVLEKTIMIIFYLLLTLIFSNWVYQYFEKPILRYRDGNYKNY